MALLSLVRVSIGEVGVLPGDVRMTSSDNLATITAAGYLNNSITSPDRDVLVSPSDLIYCLYSFANGAGTFGIFQPSLSNGVITLTEWANPGDVLLPVVNGDVAIFNGTSGQIKDSSILGSNIVSKAAVNQMAAAGQLLLDKSTGTVSTGAVTINKQSGVITGTFTTAAAGTTNVTFNNSEIAANSVILVSLMGGTNIIPGVQLSCAYASAGVATLAVTNNNVAGSALSGTLIIGFVVL